MAFEQGESSDDAEERFTREVAVGYFVVVIVRLFFGVFVDFNVSGC